MKLRDPQEFARHILEDCNEVIRPYPARQPILKKGTSIKKMLEEHPAYADVASRTIYGKRNCDRLQLSRKMRHMNSNSSLGNDDKLSMAENT